MKRVICAICVTTFGSLALAADIRLNQVAGEVKAFAELCPSLTINFQKLAQLEAATGETPNVSAIDYSYATAMNGWRGLSESDACDVAMKNYGDNGTVVSNILIEGPRQ